MSQQAQDVVIPLDVPKAMQERYISNYATITRNSGRLMLFAGDQKVEHLNKDFYGEGIHPDDGDPEHCSGPQAVQTSVCLLPNLV
jgi:DhnA family fructose-bisphosphate aldolase class Ia